MKVFISRLAIFLPALMLLLSACDNDINGSNTLATVPYDLTDFSGVNTEDGLLLTLVADSVWSVDVTTNDNFVQHLQVFVENDALTIRLDPNLSFDATKVFRATVHMPVIESLLLSGGSRADLGDGFRSTQPFTCVLSGGSETRGEIGTGELSAVLSGGSDLTLTGNGTDASLVVSGGSSAILGYFDLTNVTITASGGSDVTVHPSGVLNVEASGASEVYYRGTPTIGSITTSGGGTVKHIP